MLNVRGLRGGAVLLAILLACPTLVGDRPHLAMVPVAWRPAWSTPVGVDTVGLIAAVSDQALAVATRPDTVRVYDPHTGEILRDIPIASRFPAPITGVWVASDTLVVSKGVPDVAGQALYGYDLATGADLWQRTVVVSTQDRTAGVGTYGGPRIMVTRRGILIVERSAEPFDLHSLDPRSGRTQTRAIHPGRCDLLGSATDQSLMFLSYCAGNRVQLTSVDPRTLRPEWARRMPSTFSLPHDPEVGDPPQMDVQAGPEGYVYALTGNEGFFFAPDGRRLSSARDAVATTGLTRWTRPLFAGAYPAIGEDGGLDLSGRWPLAAYLLSLDTGTGRMGALPLTLPSYTASLVGTIRGMAFVHHEDRMFAYRLVHGLPTGPAVFGGVPARAWPDACALLTGRDLRVLADGYRPVPSMKKLAGIELPNPAACDWVPPTDDAPVLSLSIDWVSSTTADARELFTRAATYSRTNDTFDPSDESSRHFSRTVEGPAGAFGETVVNAGPVIVRLSSTSRRALRRVAPLLQDNLLARYQPGIRAPAPARRGGWSHPTDGPVYPEPVVVDDVVYAGSGDGTLQALDARTGAARWIVRTGGSIMRSPAVVKGAVYAESGGKIVALDAASGRRRWSRTIRAGRGPVVADGVLYAIDEDSEVVALGAARGKELWRFRPDGSALNTDPVVAGSVVLLGSDHGVVYGVDASSGEQRWRLPAGDSEDRVHLAVAGGVVYAANESGKVHALDAATGKVRWVSRVDRAIVSPPVSAGDAVYLDVSGRTTYALDAASGKRLWSFLAPGDDLTFDWNATTADGLVYVSGPDYRVHALDAASGAERWSSPVGDGVHSGPVVAAGTVYVGGDDGTLYALDPATGAPRWSFPTGGTIETTPVVAGDLVYVGSSNGNLFALPTAGG
ncbi:outer membrane protein assembly factor BamB family protein [Nonomuraea sp. LPB2021202275-12-8]|uniref:outer membrane protein assembly factor BamB family protein n=1 Tax=Nonomuraea sp. LPB2021202275-12-8 TaxID=3120159 RepID=UPI00300D0756